MVDEWCLVISNTLEFPIPIKETFINELALFDNICGSGVFR